MKLALFDLDGVLADDRHRVQYALSKQYAIYFQPERMLMDAVWPQGREMVDAYRTDPEWEIQYLTGRRSDRRLVTAVWLAKNGFPAGEVNVRPFHDHRRLAILKESFVRACLASGNYSDVVLFDDDPEVCRVIQENLGEQHARHCTWYIKEKAMVRTATA